MNQENKIIKHVYSILVYIFLYFPIAIVIIFSFNNSKRSLLWQGFTWDWYASLFHDTSLLIVALHSLIVGVLAASFATIIGTIAAVSIYRYRFFGKQFLNALIFILIMLPEIVMGISLLLLYSILQIPLGFWTLLLAHTAFCMPFVAVTIYGRITTLNKDIFEAAHDLGANDIVIFGKIIVPLLLPGIIAGWLLSFTLSIDDVITSYFVTGPSYEILPLRIYSMVRMGVKPEINALCSILFVLTLLFIITSQIMLRRKQA